MKNKSFDFLKELNKNREYLYNCSYKYGISKEEREDLVSDTILKAIENKDKFSTEISSGNFRGWLGCMMYNIFVNNYHRKIKHPIDNYSNEDLTVIIQGVDSKDSDSNLLTSEINEIMKFTLTDIEYKLVMGFVNGYTYEQMSEILEVSLGTIKSKIHIARKKLSKTLNIK